MNTALQSLELKELDKDIKKTLGKMPKKKEAFRIGKLFKAPSAPIRIQKAGRNEPCPCGSGKKYKKCCLNKEEKI